MMQSIESPCVPTRCPVCGAPDVRPIVCGLPGPDLAEAASRGEVVLGGCMPGDRRWACVRCKHEWGGALENG